MPKPAAPYGGEDYLQLTKLPRKISPEIVEAQTLPWYKFPHNYVDNASQQSKTLNKFAEAQIQFSQTETQALPVIINNMNIYVLSHFHSAFYTPTAEAHTYNWGEFASHLKHLANSGPRAPHGNTHIHTYTGQWALPFAQRPRIPTNMLQKGLQNKGEDVSYKTQSPLPVGARGAKIKLKPDR